MKKLIILFITTLLLTGCVGNKALQNSNTRPMEDGEKISLNWQVGWAKEPSAKPTEFVTAKVPGSVQLHIAKSKKIPSYHFGTNADLYQWMEDMHYTYKTTFKKPLLKQDQRLFINGKGIDYKYQILVNGKKVYEHEGMFKNFNQSLGSRL